MEFLANIKQFWKNSPIYKNIDLMISKRVRKKIINSKITILCPNCIAGTIYHRLGMEFLTPTINLIVDTHDFISFCLYLDYYLEQDIIFTEKVDGCPAGYLPGKGTDECPNVHIVFNHDKVNEEAQAKWDRRKRRVNLDNIYIIMYRWSGITKEELDKLEACNCKNKILLSQFKEPLVSWEYYINPKGKPDNYLSKDIFGVRFFEKKWDYVSFLNKKA